MTETLHMPLPQETEAQVAEQAREAVLRNLLPYDYDHAKDEGLIDMFYHEPGGADGLLHTLAGNLRTGETGAVIAEGFHHEPSAEVVWPSVATEEGSKPVTHVDRAHLETANARERSKYREFPLEPYQAQVVVNGLKKMAIHRDEQTGEAKVTPSKTNMFPKEYDALAVMKTVESAYKNRDPATEIPTKDVHGRDVLVSKGPALLLDGKTELPVKMILDARTKKILSAMPDMKQRAGLMKLTDKEAEKVIMGSLYNER